jgi:NTP pyrophosphatase (non-canonical NTP hydrolase)
MSDKSRETLLILQEECAEVIQAASKIFRFGEESRWPNPSSSSTHECLAMEVGQLLCMVDILIEQGYLSDEKVNAARQHKRIKLKEWSSIFEDK